MANISGEVMYKWSTEDKAIEVSGAGLRDEDFDDFSDEDY